VADVLVAQQRADVAGEAFQALGERRLHVHLQQEVHAAAQVEAQVHRQRADRGQPPGRRGQQVERHHVGRVGGIGVERLVDRVLRLELGIGVGEAEAQAVGVHQRAGVRDGGLGKRALHAREQCSVHAQRGTRAGDLDGRGLAEEVRQRIQRRDGHTQRDQRVLPGWEPIHPT
jgi:hypothetical protein